VLLQDDPGAGQVALSQVGQDVVQAVAPGDPGLAEPGRPHRPHGFGAAGEDLTAPQGVEKFRAQAPLRCGVEPSTHSHAGIGDEHVGRLLDARPGRVAELHVLGAGQGHQSGRRLDDGALAFQHGGQLFDPA